VSASDDERLPPGGFSLRHGFPQWFRRARDQGASSGIQSGSAAPSSSATPQRTSSIPAVTVYQLLEYLRFAFNEENFLNTIPLEAVANSGAYHAWHTYRARLKNAGTNSTQHSSSSSGSQSVDTGKANAPSSSGKDSSSNRPRKPGEWNWDGVWEERVKRGVQNSLSDPALYGASMSGDDIVSIQLCQSSGPMLTRILKIRFSNMESEAVQRIKDDVARTY
jgi:hypothetical protein